MCTEMLFTHWSDIKAGKTQMQAISTVALEHRQVIVMLLLECVCVCCTSESVCVVPLSV